MEFVTTMDARPRRKKINYKDVELAEKMDKMFIPVYFLPSLLGVFFAIMMGSGFWWIVLGQVIGFGLSLLMFFVIRNSLEAVKIKRRLREEEEAERERLRLEEIERSRPIEERLAEVENWALESYKENSAVLKKAEKKYSQSGVSKNLDKGYENFNKHFYEEGINDFGSKFSDLWDDSGVYKAQTWVEVMRSFAEDFALRYGVAVARAKLENDIYTANRKRALLYAEKLSEIYERLTARQKQRSIEDAADSLRIGSLNVKIPNNINTDKLLVQFSDKRIKELVETFKDYGNFILESGLPDASSALTFLGVAAFNAILSKYNDINKAKGKLIKAYMKMSKNIDKIEKGRLQADDFSKRAGELNRALEGEMAAYGKMFMQVYDALYPLDDASKSKEARAKNEQRGGDYFNDEETKAILYLGKCGQSLLKLVDVEF